MRKLHIACCFALTASTAPASTHAVAFASAAASSAAPKSTLIIFAIAVAHRLSGHWAFAIWSCSISSWHIITSVSVICSKQIV
jgi:hypothetical protein